MKITMILVAITATSFFQISHTAKANSAATLAQEQRNARPIPMFADCRETLPDGRLLFTSFIAPMGPDATQKTLRIVRTISNPSKDPNAPTSSDNPIGAIPEVIFNVTAGILRIEGEVATLAPTGFVNYSSIGTGEIIFDLPDAQEIALVASSCVFPEPGVVVGN